MGSIPIRIAIYLLNVDIENNSVCFNFAGVAQLAEQLTCNQQVVGSIPIASSIKKQKSVDK